MRHAAPAAGRPLAGRRLASIGRAGRRGRAGRHDLSSRDQVGGDRAGRDRAASPRGGRPAGAGDSPAGGTDAASPPLPLGRAARARFEQLPYWIVLAGTLLGLATIGQGAHHVRGGTFVLAGVLLIAAMARLVLPDHRAGMLSARRRLWDVATFVALGVGLLVAGLVLPAPG